ncbi:hypothetical protein Q7P36_002274 [Cladosporium allicinum]
MSPLKATTLWLLYSLGALALAHPDSNDTKLRAPALPKTSAAKVLNRRASDECTGDCATCFGSGFQLCASSSNTCYKPGDLVYGVDSCSGVGSSDVPTEPDVCTDGGCAPPTPFFSSDRVQPTKKTTNRTTSSMDLTKYSQGYQYCPNSSLYCYKPGDSLYGIENCSADASSSSSSSGSSSGSGSDAASDTSSQTTESETSTPSGSGASSTGSAGGVAGGSGDTEDTESSTTSTRSGGSSSATSGSNSNNNQGSSANGVSNGSPSQNSSGNSEIHGGLVGVLFAGGVAFVTALHLRI